MPSGSRAKTVNVPPFPPLKWDGYSWSATDTLRSWAGFQARGGPYGLRSSRKPSTGRVELHVGGESADESEPPTAEMAKAYAYLKANEDAVRDAILAALVKYYPKLREIYGDEDGDDDDDDDDLDLDNDEGGPTPLPEKLRGPDDFRKLIGVHGLHFLKASRGGVGYVGFDFGCTWDDEHGLGVMTHKDRVTQIGGADTAFLEWIAEEDAKKAGRKAAKKAAKKRAKRRPPRKRGT